MKKIAVFTLLLLASGAVSARAQTQSPDEGKEFTIRGEIAGLAVGDTLRFELIDLRNQGARPVFDVVVATPDSFEYTGRQTHPQYLIMRYLPLSGKVPRSGKSGLTMIVDGGSVTVTGNADEIYFSRIDGEAFGEQSLLREATELENSMMKERASYMRLADEAFAALDSVKGREYIQKFNEFRGSDGKRVYDLQREFINRNPSSVWSLVQRLQSAMNTPVDTLEVYYARLDTPARKSYYGTMLREKIDGLASLLPGRPAPGFSATLPDGTVMNSGQFLGKYLLIYHWGFCPGSIQREKDAVELYDRFKDNFIVLGITESLEAIRNAAETTPADSEMYGVNLKTAFESMAVHPWIDIETGTGENSRIGELFAFGGFPFFVLVSPDGKIVSRGFHDTFFEAKKILEEQYAPVQ